MIGRPVQHATRLAPLLAALLWICPAFAQPLGDSPGVTRLELGNGVRIVAVDHANAQSAAARIILRRGELHETAQTRGAAASLAALHTYPAYALPLAKGILDLDARHGLDAVSLAVAFDQTNPGCIDVLEGLALGLIGRHELAAPLPDRFDDAGEHETRVRELVRGFVGPGDPLAVDGKTPSTQLAAQFAAAAGPGDLVIAIVAPDDARRIAERLAARLERIPPAAGETTEPDDAEPPSLFDRAEPERTAVLFDPRLPVDRVELHYAIDRMPPLDSFDRLRSRVCRDLAARAIGRVLDRTADADRQDISAAIHQPGGFGTIFTVSLAAPAGTGTRVWQNVHEALADAAASITAEDVQTERDLLLSKLDAKAGHYQSLDASSAARWLAAWAMTEGSIITPKALVEQALMAAAEIDLDDVRAQATTLVDNARGPFVAVITRTAMSQPRPGQFFSRAERDVVPRSRRPDFRVRFQSETAVIARSRPLASLPIDHGAESRVRAIAFDPQTGFRSATLTNGVVIHARQGQRSTVLLTARVGVDPAADDDVRTVAITHLPGARADESGDWIVLRREGTDIAQAARSLTAELDPAMITRREIREMHTAVTRAARHDARTQVWTVHHRAELSPDEAASCLDHWLATAPIEVAIEAPAAWADILDASAAELSALPPLRTPAAVDPAVWPGWRFGQADVFQGRSP